MRIDHAAQTRSQQPLRDATFPMGNAPSPRPAAAESALFRPNWPLFADRGRPAAIRDAGLPQTSSASSATSRRSSFPAIAPHVRRGRNPRSACESARHRTAPPPVPAATSADDTSDCCVRTLSGISRPANSSPTTCVIRWIVLGETALPPTCRSTTAARAKLARLGRRVHHPLHQQRRPLLGIKSQGFTLREKNPADIGGNDTRAPRRQPAHRSNESSAPIELHLAELAALGQGNFWGMSAALPVPPVPECPNSRHTRRHGLRPSIWLK